MPTSLKFLTTILFSLSKAKYMKENYLSIKFIALMTEFSIAFAWSCKVFVSEITSANGFFKTASRHLFFKSLLEMNSKSSAVD